MMRVELCVSSRAQHMTCVNIVWNMHGVVAFAWPCELRAAGVADSLAVQVAGADAQVLERHALAL